MFAFDRWGLELWGLYVLMLRFSFQFVCCTFSVVFLGKHDGEEKIWDKKS